MRSREKSKPLEGKIEDKIQEIKSVRKSSSKVIKKKKRRIPENQVFAL